MHHPVAIANYFINQSKDGLSLMQLLKLSYIAHGFNLVFHDEPLSKELAQAWKYGPVFPCIYHTFKYHPPGKNKRLGRKVEPDPNGHTPVIESVFKDEESELMDGVYKGYGDLSGWELSDLTHEKGTPWYQFYHEGDKPGHKETKPGKNYFGITIPNEAIYEHFKIKADKIKQGEV